MPAFQPRLIIETLHRHGVRYVLIGGMAGTLHGSPLTTQDSDICPERTPENLERLARALRELHARIRTEGVDDGLAFACDAKFFTHVALVNLVTDAGSVDVAFEPSGTQGFPDLVRNQVLMPIYGIEIPVASLEDIIRSKTAANRAKDRAALPLLHEVLRQTRARAKTT